MKKILSFFKYGLLAILALAFTFTAYGSWVMEVKESSDISILPEFNQKYVCYINSDTQNNRYYTIEDALDAAGQNNTADTIYVRLDADVDPKYKIITRECEIASNDKLIIPISSSSFNFDSPSYVSTQDGYYFSSPDGNPDVSKIKNTVRIASGVTLKINANARLQIAGQLGSYGGSPHSGCTCGDYAVLEMMPNAKIEADGNSSSINATTYNAKRARIDCLGFIREVYPSDLENLVEHGSLIELKRGSGINMPLVINDWAGGSNAKATYSAGICPFMQYCFPNIQPLMDIDSFSILRGYFDTLMSGSHCSAKAVAVGNSQTSPLIIIGDGSRFEWKYSKTNTSDSRDRKTVIKAYGDFSIGSLSIDLGVSINTSSVVLPISPQYEFYAVSGSFNLSNKVKFLPGSKVVIEKDATLIVSSDTSFYQSINPDDATSTYTLRNVINDDYRKIKQTDPARLILNGKLDIKAKLGAKIEIGEHYSQVNSYINTNYNAFGTSITNKEPEAVSGSAFFASLSSSQNFTTTLTAEQINLDGDVDFLSLSKNAKPYRISLTEEEEPYWSIADGTIINFVLNDNVVGTINPLFNVEGDFNVPLGDNLSYNFRTFRGRSKSASRNTIDYEPGALANTADLTADNGVISLYDVWEITSSINIIFEGNDDIPLEEISYNDYSVLYNSEINFSNPNYEVEGKTYIGWKNIENDKILFADENGECSAVLNEDNFSSLLTDQNLTFTPQYAAALTFKYTAIDISSFTILDINIPDSSSAIGTTFTFPTEFEDVDIPNNYKFTGLFVVNNDINTYYQSGQEITVEAELGDVNGEVDVKVAFSKLYSLQFVDNPDKDASSNTICQLAEAAKTTSEITVTDSFTIPLMSNVSTIRGYEATGNFTDGSNIFIPGESYRLATLERIVDNQGLIRIYPTYRALKIITIHLIKNITGTDKVSGTNSNITMYLNENYTVPTYSDAGITTKPGYNFSPNYWEYSFNNQNYGNYCTAGDTIALDNSDYDDLYLRPRSDQFSKNITISLQETSEDANSGKVTAKLKSASNNSFTISYGSSLNLNVTNNSILKNYYKVTVHSDQYNQDNEVTASGQTKYQDVFTGFSLNGGDSVNSDTYYINESNIAGSLSSSTITLKPKVNTGATFCLKGDDKVTTPYGQKKIKDLNINDTVLTFDHFTGQFVYNTCLFIAAHNENTYEHIKLDFEDGSELNILGSHSLLSAKDKKYIDISSSNVNDYLNTEFVLTNGNEIEEVKLVSYEIGNYFGKAYSLVGDYTNNVVVNRTLTSCPIYSNYFNDYFLYDENYCYDKNDIKDQVDKYGIYDSLLFKLTFGKNVYDSLNAKYLRVKFGNEKYNIKNVIDVLKNFVFALKEGIFYSHWYM